MNTHRQLGMGNTAGAKSMEKLSSGFRINRAGDDAAGLAISEKMRGQIRGLNQASRNSQDAISLVQTAEGALNETHAITQRMRELAVQSATDTNVNVDREALQNEFDELAKEVSRIGSTTEFNTQGLLDGTFEGTFQIGANEGQNISLDVGDMRASALNLVGNAKTEVSGTIAEGTTLDIKDGTYTVDGTNLRNSQGDIVATNAAGDGLVWAGNGADTDGSDFGDDTITFVQGVDTGTITVSASGTVAKGTAEITSGTGGHNLEAGDYTANNTQLLDSAGNIIATSSDATNYISTTDGTTNILTLDAATTGTELSISVGGIDISTQANADKAITTVNNALENISAQRSKLGATQNRLEHTIKNLDTSAENLQASESRIRDVDMAKEMMEFTKNNILTQAAQAMLAQAQQQPQGVLQLLR